MKKFVNNRHSRIANRSFVKLTSFLCVIFMLLSCSFGQILTVLATENEETFSANAEGVLSETSVVFDGSGIFYSLDGRTSTASVLFTLQNAEIVEIPQTVNAEGRVYTVTSVSEGAFASNTLITEIVLPDTVTHLERHAFFGCVSLKKVTADGLLSAETDVFSGSPFISGDEFVTLGNVLLRYNGKDALVKNIPSVTFIADAFTWNPFVKTVILPEGVTQIGTGAFACAENLRVVSLPFSLEKIGNKAFFACVSLEEISIAAKVTYIGESAFSGTPFLSSLNEVQGDMIILGGGVLLRYKGNESHVSVPFGVVSISDAFAYTDVKTVELQSGCSIGAGAFRGAPLLSSVLVKGNCNGIFEFAFDGADKLHFVIIDGNFTGAANKCSFKGASQNISVYFNDGKTGFDIFSELGISAVSPERIKP